jgi:hypothetical protein
VDRSAAEDERVDMIELADDTPKLAPAARTHSHVTCSPQIILHKLVLDADKLRAALFAFMSIFYF